MNEAALYALCAFCLFAALAVALALALEWYQNRRERQNKVCPLCGEPITELQATLQLYGGRVHALCPRDYGDDVE